jgi:hypothetical protein
MSVYDSYAKVKKSSEELSIAWARAKSAWRDVKAKEFEEGFLEPLITETKKTQTALEGMGAAIERVRWELKES